jgi:hypothetical protein
VFSYVYAVDMNQVSICRYKIDSTIFVSLLRVMGSFRLVQGVHDRV